MTNTKQKVDLDKTKSKIFSKESPISSEDKEFEHRCHLKEISNSRIGRIHFSKRCHERRIQNFPEKRIRITIELYKNGKVSLMRAAELAEMDLENYKEELREREITLNTHKGNEKALETTESSLKL